MKNSTDASARFSNYGLVCKDNQDELGWWVLWWFLPSHICLHTLENTWWQQVGSTIWKRVQTTWRRWLPRTRTQTVSIPGNTVIKWKLSAISFQSSVCLSSNLRTCFGILPFISGYCDRNTRSADNSCVLLEYLSLTKIRPPSLQYIFSSKYVKDQYENWILRPLREILGQHYFMNLTRNSDRISATIWICTLPHHREDSNKIHLAVIIYLILCNSFQIIRICVWRCKLIMSYVVSIPARP